MIAQDLLDIRRYCYLADVLPLQEVMAYIEKPRIAYYRDTDL